jgi:hypothetical protein
MRKFLARRAGKGEMPPIEILIELLRKIGKNNAHIHVNVDYDGKEFHWTIPQKNPTADEWCPRELRPKNCGPLKP